MAKELYVTINCDVEQLLESMPQVIFLLYALSYCGREYHLSHLMKYILIFVVGKLSILSYRLIQCWNRDGLRHAPFFKRAVWEIIEMV